MGARGQRVSGQHTQAGLPRQVVLLHGGSRHESFVDLARRLARVATLRALGLDEGASFASDLERAMPLVANDPVVLLGHGYGAALALALAQQVTVQGLMLVEPLALGLLRGTPCPELDRVRTLASRTIELCGMGQPEDAASVHAALFESDPVEAARMPALAAQLSNLAHHTPGELAPLDVPVVILRGQKSPWLTRQSAAHLARAMPDAKLFEVAAAGHDMPFTHPGELSFVLRRAVLSTLELA